MTARSSMLARELRAVAQDLLTIGATIPASFAHAHALMLEAGQGDASLLSPYIVGQREPLLIDLDDCPAVYGDEMVDEMIFTDLDEHNDCSNAGGHLWLAKDGDVRCVHCPAVAMPVKASREAV
jgi:hypothetical protein